MESQVFSLINGERSKPLIEHAGLLDVARMNSMRMARDGGLEHDSDDEIMAAQPDPPQGSGAPDNGFAVAAWCEDVTYSTGFPESQVAQKLYEQWHNSPPHQACMTNESKNVGAVGIYYDGTTWWATFIAEVDSTPPGGASRQAAPAQAAAVKSSPAASHSPAPAQSSAPAQTRPAPAAVGAPVTGHVVGSAPLASDAPSPASAAPAAPVQVITSRSSTAPRYSVGVQPLAALKTWTRSRHVAGDVAKWSGLFVLELLILVGMRRVRAPRFANRYPKMRADAMSAPSRSTRSFSQEMSSAIVRNPAAVSNPQSVPARTLVGSSTS
jgi:hypothetical protein